MYILFYIWHTNMPPYAMRWKQCVFAVVCKAWGLTSPSPPSHALRHFKTWVKQTDKLDDNVNDLRGHAKNQFKNLLWWKLVKIYIIDLDVHGQLLLIYWHDYVKLQLLSIIIDIFVFELCFSKVVLIPRRGWKWWLWFLISWPSWQLASLRVT